jgi:hypothetical protein
MASLSFNAEQDRRDELAERMLDARDSCDLRAFARGVPLADFECPHGYIGDGPCACFQFTKAAS